LLRGSLQDALDFRGRAVQYHVRFQTANNALVEHVSEGGPLKGRERHGDIHIAGNTVESRLSQWEDEGRGHHADHSVGLSIEVNRPADYIAASVQRVPPVPIADDRDLPRVLIFLVTEYASDFGPSAKHIEQRGGNSIAIHPLGPIDP
jgi:hypothetical protein